MARTLPTADLHALVRQASAERFPHPVPAGMPARRRNLSDPGMSNVDLWAFYSMPEVRTIADRISSGVERVHFRPALNVEGAPADKCPPLINEDGTVLEGISPQLAVDCAEIWSQVRAPSGPQSGIFGAIATCLTVAGDAWQFGYPGTPEMRWDPAGLPMWVGVARDAITELSGEYVCSVGIDGLVRVPVHGDGHGTAIRIWNEDPQRPAMASTWMASCVRSLQILSSIYEAVAAVALSRMNAGFIITPDDQDQLPIPTSSIVGDGNPGLYPLGTPLRQALYDEIADDVESAQEVMDGLSRAVPSVIGVNSTIADKVRWLETARNMDPQLGERIDDLRGRIFRASPLPPEVSEGMSDLSGLGGGNVAAQIDLSEYQRAILPVCEKIAWANTQFVLREGLLARGYSQLEVDRVQIGFTGKNLLLPPDTSKIAVEVARLPNPVPALSNAELREATGLAEFAGPDPEEAQVHTILHLAAANPAYSYLLPLVGLPAPEPPSPEAPTEVIDVADEPALESGAPAAWRAGGPPLPPVLQAATDSLDRETGQRQVAIATRYEEQLATLIDSIIARMAERASSRVQSLALRKSWAGVRDTVRTAPPELVGAVPQVRALLAAESVDDGDLFEPALATFAAQFDNLTRRAQRASIREVGGDWDRVEADADEANAAAWALLGGLLVAEGRRRFEGQLPEQVEGEGALSPFGIPAAVITRVSAVAGGQVDAMVGGANSVTAAVPWRTIATGPIAERAARDAGRVILGYLWDYRPELERNSYEPHLDMHGVFGFNEDDFDGQTVGDHPGCLCTYAQVYGAI